MGFDIYGIDEIKKGDKLLFTAVGAGWAWGSMILNYED